MAHVTGEDLRKAKAQGYDFASALEADTALVWFGPYSRNKKS